MQILRKSRLQACPAGLKVLQSPMGFSYDDIFLPLAITVVIDQKVRTPELRSFTQQGMGLIELFGLDPLSADDLRKWFRSHKNELEKKLSTPRRNTLVLRALSKFTDGRDVEAVYDAMVSISVSDKEYVKQESELIKSAAAIWGFSRPPIKIDKK